MDHKTYKARQKIRSQVARAEAMQKSPGFALGIAFVLLLIGAVFLWQGWGRISTGEAELNVAQGGSSSTRVVEKGFVAYLLGGGGLLLGGFLSWVGFWVLLRGWALWRQRPRGGLY